MGRRLIRRSEPPENKKKIQPADRHGHGIPPHLYLQPCHSKQVMLFLLLRLDTVLLLAAVSASSIPCDIVRVRLEKAQKEVKAREEIRKGGKEIKPYSRALISTRDPAALVQTLVRHHGAELHLQLVTCRLTIPAG